MSTNKPEPDWADREPDTRMLAADEPTPAGSWVNDRDEAEPFADWDTTKAAAIRKGKVTRRNARRFLAAAASIIYALFAAVTANADEAPSQPVKSGWVWHLPDGTVQGTCKAGYRPVWSEVPDYSGKARYWGGGKQWLTWEQLAAVRGSNPLSWGYMFNNGYETVTAEPEAGKLYEGDCILTTHEIPGGTNSGSDDDVKPIPTPTPTPDPTPSESATPTPEPTPEPSSTSTPTPTPEPTEEPPCTTPEPTTPGMPGTSSPSPSSEPTDEAPAPPTKAPTPPAPPVKPAPAKPAPAPRVVTRVFQVDRYAPTTARERAIVRNLPRDGVLKFREDRALWGKSRWSFVTLRLPAKASNATTLAAVRKVTKLRPLHVWELNSRASVKAPWGRKGDADQRFIGVVR